MTQITKVMLTAGSVLLATLVGVIPGLRPLAELNAAQPAPVQIVTLDGAADCPHICGQSGPRRRVHDQWEAISGRDVSQRRCFERSCPSVQRSSATQYYMFNNGQNGITTEGYISTLLSPLPLSITGGIGNFRGASGDVEGTLLGTNVSGCPNFRVRFNVQPGSIRGISFN